MKLPQNQKFQGVQRAHQGVLCMILHILDQFREANPRQTPLTNLLEKNCDVNVTLVSIQNLLFATISIKIPLLHPKMQ